MPGEYEHDVNADKVGEPLSPTTCLTHIKF